MQTLKIKYCTEDCNYDLINRYRREFSNVLRYAFNRRIEGISEKDTENLCASLNNIQLIKSYLIRSAVKYATQLVKTKKGEKLIFGGKKNFIERCKGVMDKETFINNRLSKIYIIGEAVQYANRFVRINADCESFEFKPERGTDIRLQIAGGYKRYKRFIKRLYELQESKSTPISYQLDNEYIYVIFDERVINKEFVRKDKPIKNRVFAIDLNPNYVGWSVVDWMSSSEYNIIKTGVISIKTINDEYNAIKKTPSNDAKKIYLNNKRVYETLQISKLLVNTALHYRCEMFCMEELSVTTNDKEKGRRYNRLVNNQWNRNKLIDNIKKRCNIHNLECLEIVPRYSSFIGNFLFRDGINPDMVLSSIEIGRRGYEFRTQYITKEKEHKKNIIQPIVNDFIDNYIKSLEEFGIEGEFKDLIELYYFLKNAKCKYRVSFEDVNIQDKFSRCFSMTSKINKVLLSA